MPERQRLGRRGEALRRAVLEATIGEIASVGIAAASIQSIAERAGVHDTSIYRRWKTRERLFFDALMARSDSNIGVPDTGSLRGDLIEIARSVIAFNSSPNGLAVLQAATQLPTEHDSDLRAFWQSRERALSDVFARAVQRGELASASDGSLILQAVVSPLHFRTLLSREAFEGDLPERLVDIVLRGGAVR
ncbi:TetR/AcrR family transcriptional regulator [Mycobacterium shigaense]|uniref:TetR/AcrR family transcriptional regulator n=1 Tax=Mycobacterium shigaense TaxID=722731 RepID=UPI002AE0A02F|nr:TetR/AcrR family transcriptional regulator [Mycobacterium shigaense]MEA1121407.1 TetR/AcrR family transcriptional regulator [Mycobacterium shigaense]